MQTADIIIIGGGIAGISAAARLAPQARVIVLEMEANTAYHTTGRSAAMYVHNYGNSTLRSLSGLSLPELISADFNEGNTLLSPRGALSVATVAHNDKLDAYLNDSRGIDEISVQEALELFPVLRPDAVHRAAIEREAADIDTDRMMQGFTRIFKQHHGQILLKQRVTDLHRENNVWQIKTTTDQFQSPIVINAAGAWADQLATMAGLQTAGLTPMRRSAALVAPPAEHDLAPAPLCLSSGEDWYIKPQSGRLMLSPADEDPVEPHDAWPDDRVLAEGIHRIEQVTTLNVEQVEYSWAGLRTFAPDRTPVIGFAPDSEGFFWLAGQGGYGIQTAPGIARLVAALVMGDTDDYPPELLQAVAAGRRSNKV